MRIGHGYDVHRLEGGRKLILGGVHIPCGKGLSGHSDADVLVHAVMDALLGAAALGDIGQHFPDSDEKFRGADLSLIHISWHGACHHVCTGLFQCGNLAVKERYPKGGPSSILYCHYCGLCYVCKLHAAKLSARSL